MEEIDSEIPRDQKQWSLSASKMELHLQEIIKFAEQRPAIIINNLHEHFKNEDHLP